MTGRRFKQAMEGAGASVPAVEPTPDEARNGWTAETLTEYVRERTAAQSLRIDPMSTVRRTPPRRANSVYRPLRWRG